MLSFGITRTNDLTLLTASLVMMTIHYYFLWQPPTGASAHAPWGGCRDTIDNLQSSIMIVKMSLWCVCILLTYHIDIRNHWFFSVCVPMFLSQSGAWVRSKAGQGRVPVSWRPRQSHLAIIRAELGPREPMRYQGHHTLTNHNPGAGGDYYWSWKVNLDFNWHQTEKFRM